MTRPIKLFAYAALLAVGLSGPAFAQSASTTTTIVTVDSAALNNGYRASKLLGGKVYNEANETVGTVDDLIVTNKDTVLYAVLSVGGFLGIGDKLVVVPYSALQVHEKRIVLLGATKASLKALPVYKYTE